jgi:nucleoid DNA-binding protein
MAKAAKKPLTKTQIIASIAEDTDLTKKDVSAVFDSMTKLIKKSLGRSGAGSFTLPGILKIEKKRVPARPARKNAPNPFRPGETMDIPAKPAHNKVKVRPLKNLKDMA